METSESVHQSREVDPSYLTTQQLWREIGSLKELLLSRIEGVERSIIIAHDDLVRVPTDVQKHVGNLKELVEKDFHTVYVKFESVQKQFDERDVRTQQDKEASTTAVNAALQAQKESAAKQQEAFKEMIQKLEDRFSKQIDLNAELFRAEVRGLTTQNNELKDRLTRNEAKGEGAGAYKVESRASNQYVFGAIGLVLAILAFVLGLLLKQ